jgi:hypothetical protein
MPAKPTKSLGQQFNNCMKVMLTLNIAVLLIFCSIKGRFVNKQRGKIPSATQRGISIEAPWLESLNASFRSGPE